MLFTWWRRRRRRRILATPFPAAWDEILESIPHVQVLVAGDPGRHREAVQIFLAEKTFEGCAGLELTEPMRVTVAGLASLLCLGMGEYVFDNVHTILMYPDA